MALYLNGERVALRGFKPSDEQSDSTLKILLDATKSTYYLFYQSTITTAEGLIGYNDTENVTNMNSMFYYCRNLTTVPLFNTQNATDMGYMFRECRNLTTVPLFNTENVKTMNGMFAGCKKLTTVPLFNTQNVTSMESMFNECSLLENVSLNAEKVTSVYGMFSGCSNLKTVKLSKVSNKIYQTTLWFYNCSSLEVVDFSDAVGVPTLSGSNPFTSVPTTCQIVIPDELYDTWTTATNWIALTQTFVKASEYTGG